MSSDLAKILKRSKDTYMRCLTELDYKSVSCQVGYPTTCTQPGTQNAAICETFPWSLAHVFISRPSYNWQRNSDFMKQLRGKWPSMKPHDSAQRPRVNRYGMKFFLCIILNSSDVLNYSLLEKGRMVHFDFYYRQLAQASDKYRFHHGTTTEMFGPILRYDNICT